MQKWSRKQGEYIAYNARKQQTYLDANFCTSMSKHPRKQGGSVGITTLKNQLTEGAALQA